YIPLGGNRCSKPRAYFNQFATMVIGGFWHGASWMYVIWGGAHGALLVIHKMTAGLLPSSTVTQTVITETGQVEMVTTPSRFAPVMRGLGVIVTFLLIAATFMLFRAPSMEDVGTMWHQIIYDFHPSVAPQFVESYFTIVLAIVIGYVVHMLPTSVTAPVKRGFMASPVALQTIALAAVLLIAIQVRSSDIVPFIYLQY
ncbi:MAG: MBOAT family protein, partial [Duncaniella sp.]|nr:MBOAT family protein [Duncaniella sp.]